MSNDHKSSHPRHFQIKEEIDEPSAVVAGKAAGAISHSNGNAQNQQYSSNPCASSRSPPTVPVTQLHHQLPHLTSNQHGYPPSNQPQSFWMPPHQHPGGNGPPFFHSFPPHQYPNWQPNDHTHVPNLHNQVGYAYPPCPGPWDPSSWWGRPPLAYAFPGSYSQVSQHHPMTPPCSTPSEQSSERGIIKPLAKLSQKHLQPWEAQSAENVKVWTVIDQLQSELSDFKSRVVKLEEEISSLKQTKGEPITCVTSTGGQPAKRGRRKRSAALVDALPSLDEPRPCTQGRKIREPIFEKVILSKAENNVIPVHLAALAQQGKGKVSNLMIGEGKGLNCSVINGSNATMPSFHNQVHKENAIMQNGGIDSNGKVADANDTFAILTKGMDHRTALASCHSASNNGSLGWPYPYAILPPQANGNIIANMNPESVSKQGEKVNGGPGVVSEEDASGEPDDAMAAKAEDDNDEEMGEDESSSGEEIGC
ncbi:hypothetical protein M5689_013511 [Euphorbia peplus]|nr:hypothetical protein M5689_013511 [Euphorbia peplus]